MSLNLELISIYIENDANLFALGEWKKQEKKASVFGAITLGTGLGFGIIINEKFFQGEMVWQQNMQFRL